MTRPGGQQQQVMACGICRDTAHFTDQFPELQEPNVANVHAMGGYRPPRPRYDRPEQYEQRWRGQPQQSNSSPSTKELLNKLTQNFVSHVHNTESSIKHIERQIGQIAQTMSTLAQSQSNSLPAQTEVNPQVRNVSAITLRSRKHLGGSPLAEKD